MKLRVISNYGSKESLITEQATPDEIVDVIDGLNWTGFHQVVLEKPNGDWLEVGGSLNPSDGLSIMYQESRKQHVVAEAPTDIEELKLALKGYLTGSDDWKLRYRW